MRLGEIELLATATFFDEGPTYTGQNNLLRGNFIGSLGSSRSDCIANRQINFFREMPGSAPAVLVAITTTDNSGTTGNFTSSEWHDPPGVVDTYYAVVIPDEAKDCAGVTSDPIVV